MSTNCFSRKSLRLIAQKVRKRRATRPQFANPGKLGILRRFLHPRSRWVAPGCPERIPVRQEL